MTKKVVYILVVFFNGYPNEICGIDSFDNLNDLMNYVLFRGKYWKKMRIYRTKLY